MGNKKKIIIDGIDVSRCEYACNTILGKIACKHPVTKYIYCFNNPNCYFKQLQCKTAECEDLKEIIKIIFASLIIANDAKIGAIQDTIWVNDYTTLWDYIKIVLNMDDKEFKKFEKQALQKDKRTIE